MLSAGLSVWRYFVCVALLVMLAERNAQNVLLDGLEKLEYRGYDSAGVARGHWTAGIARGQEQGPPGQSCDKKTGIARRAVAESGCGIGHTRWATHGAPSDANTPIRIRRPRWSSIVHNGIIENYGES